MLGRAFFKLYIKDFLPKLASSSPNNVQKQIDEIANKKEMFMKSHMAYKGFIGTIEYSTEDKVYFGKLLNIKDMVLYEADKEDQLRASFYETIEHHLGTLD